MVYYKEFSDYSMENIRMVKAPSKYFEHALEQALKQVSRILLKLQIMSIDKSYNLSVLGSIKDEILNKLEPGEIDYIIATISLYINIEKDSLSRMIDINDKSITDKIFYFENNETFGYFKISNFDNKYHYCPDLSLIYNDIFNIEYPDNVIINEEKLGINYKPKDKIEAGIIEIITALLSGKKDMRDRIDNKLSVTYNEIVYKILQTTNAKYILI